MNLPKCKKRSRTTQIQSQLQLQSRQVLSNLCSNTTRTHSFTTNNTNNQMTVAILLLCLSMSNLPCANSLMSHDPAFSFSSRSIVPSMMAPSIRLSKSNNRRISNMNMNMMMEQQLGSNSNSQSKQSSTKLHMIKYVQLFSDSDKVEETTTDNSRWLSWMTGGTPRGVADVKMRDPIALGGVPRSDRYASRDWLHNTINLANSAILKDIAFPVCFMTCWGAVISLIHAKLNGIGRMEAARNMCIPVQAHSLTVSALGLLLVFRTNSAYQRFTEGRRIWEDILSVARDLSRLVKLYEAQIGTAKVRRVNRLLAAFPYLLRFRIKPNSIMRKLDDPDVKRDPETSLILYQDHGTYKYVCVHVRVLYCK